MREICTSGSVGGEDGNVLAYPAKSRLSQLMGGAPTSRDCCPRGQSRDVAWRRQRHTMAGANTPLYAMRLCLPYKLRS
jgi:hypothetical protein